MGVGNFPLVNYVNTGTSSLPSEPAPPPMLRTYRISILSHCQGLDPRFCGELIVSNSTTPEVIYKIVEFIRNAHHMLAFEFRPGYAQVNEDGLSSILDNLGFYTKIISIKFSYHRAPLTLKPLTSLAWLISTNRTLTQLILGDIREIDPQGLSAIFESIREHNKTLKSVKLIWSLTELAPNLTEVAPSIARALAENTTLRELVLNGKFQMTEESIALIAGALPSNTGLTSLELTACTHKNSIGEVKLDCFKALINGLRYNKSLQCVAIKFFDTLGGKEVAEALFQTLSTNRSIKYLGMIQIKGLDFDCFQKIFEALRFNRELEYLDLDRESNEPEAVDLERLIQTIEQSMDSNPYYVTRISNFFKNAALLRRMNLLWESHTKVLHKCGNLLDLLLYNLDKERTPIAPRQRLPSAD